MKIEGNQKLLDYWRNNLADAARVEIPVEKSLHVRKAIVNLAEGAVDVQQANYLINEAEVKLNTLKGVEDRTHADWQDVNQITVLIAFFYVSPIPEYAKYTGETGAFYPFWMRALMNRAGKLSVDDDTFPYVPRTYLEPQVNEDVNFTFSDVKAVDEAFSRPFTGKTWKEYKEYISLLFQDVTGLPLEKYAVAGFKTFSEPVILVPDTLPNAADGIIHLYDHLRNERQVPKLLQNLCDKEPAPTVPLLTADGMETYSLQHLGQMGHEYPLSISQRSALYHFLTQKPGDILAVNGPPGTGKTTLLQSIVANEVVAGAIEGNQPRIILASSTNNQAVTNIIDSFSNVKARSGVLYQRWLPKVKGFALFLPSKDRVVKDDIPVFKAGGAYPGGLEDKEYLASARQAYLEKFAEYTGGPAASVKHAVNSLQQRLKEAKADLEKGLQLWRAYKEKLQVLLPALGAFREINWQNGQLDTLALEEITRALKTLEGEVNNYLDRESIWVKLFSFLPFVKEKRVRRLKQIFRDCPLDYTGINFYQPGKIHQYFDLKFSQLKQIHELDKIWQAWKTQRDIQGNPPFSESQARKLSAERRPHFYDELETGLKNDLFYLAVHYWEGRWLLETGDALQEGPLYKKRGQSHLEKQWQRFAMLTPCLVSNFYMAPKFFKYSKFIKDAPPGNEWETPPLYEIADLLIVDEAGQVSPEIGAATFSLAKRALVVGDTQQIEPVWNVLPKVDHANLHRSGLISHRGDAEAISDWNDKGVLCSSGCVMKLAQKSSCFRIFPDIERGMLLTEHRRCFDEIIGYCNKVAYNGLLEPMKGPAKGHLLPPMAFIHVNGMSETVNSSRANKAEAAIIAEWLRQRGDSILEHYQGAENATAAKEGRNPVRLVLSDLVGIITPFTAQKWAIKSALKNEGIDTNGFTIGTVHALQGAERPVILFSSVYGSNDSKIRFFFDMGVNMLNVAVSRAKESFIMFGCRGLYADTRSNTWSAQLYRHIEDVGEVMP